MLEGWCGKWTFPRKEIVSATKKQAANLYIFGPDGSVAQLFRSRRLLSSPISQELSIFFEAWAVVLRISSHSAFNCAALLFLTGQNDRDESLEANCL